MPVLCRSSGCVFTASVNEPDLSPGSGSLTLAVRKLQARLCNDRADRSAGDRGRRGADGSGRAIQPDRDPRMSGRSRRGSANQSGRQQGPERYRGPALAPGAPVSIVHAKPWKRTITMRGTVASWDGELLTVERTFAAGGQYDSLHVPKLAGDWGTIEVPRGGWILRRAYFRRDGSLIGELFNIQTPAEIDARGVRYVDLEVDVVRRPDGSVAIVDEDDLDAAVRAGGLRPELAERAREVARRLAAVLRAGGDWRSVARDEDVR